VCRIEKEEIETRRKKNRRERERGEKGEYIITGEDSKR
jgi:hypothetical protein